MRRRNKNVFFVDPLYSLKQLFSVFFFTPISLPYFLYHGFPGSTIIPEKGEDNFIPVTIPSKPPLPHIHRNLNKSKPEEVYTIGEKLGEYGKERK